MEKKITRTQLSQILKDPKTYNGCTFTGIDMLTEVPLTGGKKNPMQGRVTKQHTGFLAMLFSNKVRSAYGTMVNKRLSLEGKEANFEPSRLPWGERVEGTSAIEHKGNDYVQLIYVQRAVNLYDYATRELNVQLNDSDRELIEMMKARVAAFETRNGEVQYFLDGKPVKKEEIQGLPESKEGEQGGLGDLMKVIVRSPKLESVTRMTFGGVTYIVED